MSIADEIINGTYRKKKSIADSIIDGTYSNYSRKEREEEEEKRKQEEEKRRQEALKEQEKQEKSSSLMSASEQAKQRETFGNLSLYERNKLMNGESQPLKSAENLGNLYDAKHLEKYLEGQDDGNKLLKSSEAFKDGYDFGDVTKTIASTAGNLGTSFLKGVSGIGTATGKLLASGVAQVADLVGQDEYADRVRGNIAGKNERVNKWMENYTPSGILTKANNKLDNSSILGKRTDNAIEGTGYYAGMLALQSMGVPWQVTAGVTSAGNELSNAYAEGASDAEAWISAGISAGAEIGSEYLSGGVKLPGTGKTAEAVIDGLTDKIKSKAVKTLTKFGINAVGEGAEEVISGLGSALGKKLTYMSDKELKEIYSSEQALDDFITGTISSAIVGGAQQISSNVANNNALQKANETQELPVTNEVNRYENSNINNVNKNATITENNKNANVENDIETSKRSYKINEKVAEYINNNKEKFSTDINIDTNILNTPDNLISNYKNVKETVLYDKARKLFSNLHKRVFKNNNQNIYVTNADINESIHKTVTNQQQKNLIKENLAVFSQLDKIIENGELISSEKIDNKGRSKYSNYEYYVSKANIDGQPYIVEFDTRLQQGTSGKLERHFRLERVYKLNETDSVSGTDNSMSHFGPESVSIDTSIPHINENVKSDSDSINYTQETENNTQNQAPTADNNVAETGTHTKARKHYDSIIKSQYTSDEAKAIAKELMGTDTYVPESNNKQLERADERIRIGGAESELTSLMSRAMTGGNIKADDIAVGERLIQYYSKSGNKSKLQDAIQATAMAGTTAGQTVQAMSLLNHQTPEGQAIWLQRSVEKMNSDLRKTRGDNAEQFNLTPDMLEKITNSQNAEELQNNLNEVYKELGQQVSKTTMQKIDSWRYFAMLANPKTHIRNIGGNFVMGMTQGVKNKVAGSIEGVVSKFNPDMERTHTIAFASEEVKSFAKSDIQNVADRLSLNENKYNPKTRLENNMRTFKSDIMEKSLGKAFEIDDNLLEAEDGWGLKAGYVRALSEYMTANKLNPENITDKQLAKARNYAVEQAKEATFHQNNALSSAINQLSNKNKFAKFFLDAILPYKKTPMNIAKAGLEYSPIGLVKSAVYDTAQLKKGNITVNKYIDNISKGLTGTGIALLGYALANAGILKASGSDDKDAEEYSQKLGNQTYSIKIGDNTFSLDWIAPSGIPLFIGAECYEIMQASKQEKTSSSSDEDSLYNQAITSAVNILDGFTNAMNPMTEMSMLSGLTSALKSYEQGSSKVLANLGVNSVKSYVNQFVPTALSQIARTTDDYERSTTTTKTGVLPKSVDSTKNYIMSKVPGLRQMLPVKTDVWGNEVKQSSNVALRTLENSVFPWTRKSISTTDVDNEILNVYESTGESSVLPASISKNFTINKEKYIMTSEEYAKYGQQYGETSYNLLDRLTRSKQYSKMTGNQKQKAIESVYDYAKEQIKIDYAKQNNLEYEESTLSKTVNAIQEANGNISNYFEYTALTDGKTKNNEKMQVLINANYSNKTKQAIYENNILDSDDEKYSIVKEIFTDTGLNINKYLRYKSQEFVSDKEDDGTLNGKSISGSKKQKVYDYIYSIPGASYTQKTILYALEYEPKTSSDKNIVINYVEGLHGISAEKRREILSKFKGITVYKNGRYEY